MTTTTTADPGARIREVFDRARNQGALREVLQVFAEGVTEVAGFGVAAISLLRSTDDFEVVAVAGSDEARDALLGRFTARADVEIELEVADHWGSLRFVPHERVHDTDALGWVPDLEPADDEDAWHPMDLLMAPMYDDQGELSGLISVDLPADGRRPGIERQQLLESYAARAGRVLARSTRESQLSEEARLNVAARRIVRHASSRHSIAEVLADIREAIVEGFQALGMWLQVFGGDLPGDSTIYSADGAVVDLPPALEETAERAARAAWAEQRVSVVSWRRPHDGLISPEERESVLEFLASVEVESILFAPLGAGEQCLGNLVLTRSRKAPPWSDAELAAALEIGHDLGRALLNARLFEREQLLNSELRELATYKSQLMSTLGHELKTPLTSVVGNLELLEDVVDGPAGSRVAAMQRATDRLQTLIDDLMRLARASDPHVCRTTDSVDLAQLVGLAVEILEVQAGSRGIRVLVDAPGGPFTVRGDPAELERVCLNLIGNAVKYSPDGTTVTVGLHRPDHHVVLSVRDEGIGISEADQERLFTEFFRSTNPDAATKPGSGLGLTIVKRTVEQHGGTIEVESTLGVGSTFTVRLPTDE